ncbi:hypothetical protein Dimus_016471 [Dionaea muscipula]
MFSISPIIYACMMCHGCMRLGGPSWIVLLGRRDSTTTSLSEANTDLPGPTSDLSTLITKFTNKGLIAQDMTALSGAHTIAKLVAFSSGAESIMTPTSTPPMPPTSRLIARFRVATTTWHLSTYVTPTNFDNDYYRNLSNEQGLLHSDQELFNGGSRDSLVQTYANDNSRLRSDFVNSMINMGNISPSQGLKARLDRIIVAVNS